ncbi:hypothetical protein IJX73_02075 [bacterium]|nr:hypothetical protein [bacterium]MBQ9149696.1 hypothetical protein [bacterium]
MQDVSLSQANQILINKQEVVNSNNTNPIEKPEVQLVEDGCEKMNKALLALGVIGAAGITLACALHGKNVNKLKNAPIDEIQKQVTKLNDISFTKGIAKKQDGTLFTGVVEDVLKNGDSVVMEYKDGVIKSSKRTGKKQIEKTFIKNSSEELAVSIHEDGKASFVNVTQMANKAKADNDKLAALLNDNAKMTSAEFKAQTDRIKYKNKQQQEQVNDILDKKITSEKKAAEDLVQVEKATKIENEKREAERLRKEAEEKQKADRLKKEAEDKQKYIDSRDKEIMAQIEASKKLNKRVDEIMAASDFNDKLDRLLHTKIVIPNGLFNSGSVEATIDEFLDSTIKGNCDKPLGTLYHGTTAKSKSSILQKGFSLDACSRGESGKGVYFATKSTGGDAYDLGGLIKAKYTGEKVANVKAGAVGELVYGNQVRLLFEEVFGHKFLQGESDELNFEILSRIYTKKLKDMGYDAIHSASVGAGCDYVAILDPSKIEIIK